MPLEVISNVSRPPTTLHFTTSSFRFPFSVYPSLSISPLSSHTLVACPMSRWQRPSLLVHQPATWSNQCSPKVIQNQKLPCAYMMCIQTLHCRSTAAIMDKHRLLRSAMSEDEQGERNFEPLYTQQRTYVVIVMT